MADRPDLPPDQTTFPIHPIGVVRSTLTALDEAPRQGDEGAPDVVLALQSDLVEALDGLAVGDEVLVLTWFHQAARDQLTTQPRNDPARARLGVFATRSPDRPNPIGLHQVTVRSIEGSDLVVGPCEAIDGTPVVDVKPVLGARDSRSVDVVVGIVLPFGKGSTRIIHAALLIIPVIVAGLLGGRISAVVEIEVVVSDDGDGLPAGSADEVFQPFALATGAGSSGIGLAISRSIIEARSGTVTASNRDEGGARVTIAVPLVPWWQAADVEEGHVLVVDDDPTLLRLVEMALQMRGYRVTTAINGKQALDQVDAVDPDVVVLELELPDIDGLDVGRHIRARSRASVLVLTADGSEDCTVQALEGPADDCITKPFSTRELVARVGVAMRHQNRYVAATADDRSVDVGKLHIDIGGHTADVDGTFLELTAKEFALLVLLARNQGRVVGHKAILTSLWGPNQGVDTLRTHVNQLRRKLEVVDGSPKLVNEVRVGYRLVPV